MMRRILISCGPIPARLDSVKFIANRFRGGLAFETARILSAAGFDVSAICWEFAAIPEGIEEACAVETVSDVVDYCNRIRQHAENRDFDAYIMSAAVANLMPSVPWKGKFPSHEHSVGERFDIAFEIAPRAIDLIKSIDPHVTLIGYKLFDGSEEELIAAARQTLRESHADIIFANHPATAKDRKIAVMSDNAIIPLDFDEHVNLIARAVTAMHYKTEIASVVETEDMMAAKNIVRLYETTFDGFGTVAVPVEVEGYPRAFATTSRGHTGEPVIVLKVDHSNRIVYATGKATLNAPTLAVALSAHRHHVVIHRHPDDPRYRPSGIECSEYLFPGTAEEAQGVLLAFETGEGEDVILPHHGSIALRGIGEPDWQRYEELFPKRYLGDKPEMENAIAGIEGEIGCPLKEAETLEIGSGRHALAKYAYDPYAAAEDAVPLSWEDIEEKPDGYFELVLMRNSIAYLDPGQLELLARKSRRFLANAFAKPSQSMLRGNECSHIVDGMVEHTLLMDDDSLVCHSFHAYDAEAYRNMGFDTEPYGANSILITLVGGKKAPGLD